MEITKGSDVFERNMQGKQEHKFQAPHATLQSASAEPGTTESSQNQNRWMTSDDIKLNRSINSQKYI